MKNPAGAVIAVAMAVGFVLPGPAGELAPALPWLLVSLMFLGCLDVRAADVVSTLRQPARVIALLATIHLLPALLAQGLAPLIGVDFAVGLLLAAATSSGLSVVFLSRLLGGQPGKALALTVLSNVATPVAIPVLMAALAGAEVIVDPIGMARGIAGLVCLPLALAAAVGRTRAGPWLRQRVEPLSLGFLFFLLVGVIGRVGDQLVDRPAESLVVGGLVVFLAGVTFVVGYSIGRTRPERLTFGLVASYKNYTLATVLALEYLGPAAAVPAVLFAIVNNLALIPLQLLAPTDSAGDAGPDVAS